MNFSNLCREFRAEDFILLVLYLYSLLNTEESFVDENDERVLQVCVCLCTSVPV